MFLVTSMNSKRNDQMMQQKKNDTKKVSLKKLNKKASKLTRGADGPIIEFFTPSGVMHYG